jgi:hypothetical protein
LIDRNLADALFRIQVEMLSYFEILIKRLPSRELQRKTLTLWKGNDANVPAAQAAFIEQAKLNALATQGQLII